jgi:hypothetical protein
VINVPFEELQAQRLERTISDRTAWLADRFSEMGWTEESGGSFWSEDRRPRQFRRLVTNYVGLRDALSEFDENVGAGRRSHSDVPGGIFLHYLAERIGYEKFREIVTPHDGQVKPYGKHAFENSVVGKLAEELSAALTDEGKRYARRFGGPEKLLLGLLTHLDTSASQAMEEFLHLYGETEGAVAVLESIEKAQEQDIASFRANISNMFG